MIDPRAIEPDPDDGTVCTPPDGGNLHSPVQTNDTGDAWCGTCGERLLLPGFAGGPE